MNNINWLWLGSDVIALKTVDIHFLEKQAFYFEGCFIVLEKTNCIVIRQYLGNPISDYDNQVYL